MHDAIEPAEAPRSRTPRLVAGGACCRPLQPHEVDLTAELCALLASPQRLQALRALRDGEQGFAELRRRVRGSAAQLAAQLTALCRSGLATRRREGRATFYRLLANSRTERCLQLFETVIGPT